LNTRELLPRFRHNFEFKAQALFECQASTSKSWKSFKAESSCMMLDWEARAASTLAVPLPFASQVTVVEAAALVVLEVVGAIRVARVYMELVSEANDIVLEL
jgi:hypothetical protein